MLFCALEKGDVNRVLYVLVGEDLSRMEYNLEVIKKKEQCDQIDRYNALSDPKEVIENALETFSLFSQKPMVIIENSTFLGAKNTTPLEPSRIQAKISPDQVVVLMAPIKKVDSRKKAIKAILEQAIQIDCSSLDEKSQPPEVKKMLQERKLKMESDAFEWFCENAGFSAPVLASQLDKLALYADHITLEDVKALVTVEPTKNVFKMTDALFARDAVRLLELYRTFRFQNMEPLAILGLLASQIRFVYQVKVLLEAGYSQKELMEKLGASSGRIWNTQKIAYRFSANELLENLALLADLDQSIKQGEVDKDTAFERFILQIGRSG